MAALGSTISTTVTHGVTLGTSAPSFASPLTITPVGAVYSGTSPSAIYGPSGGPWSIANQGLVEASGSNGLGIDLQSSGTITNSGTIEATGTAGYGVTLANGGLIVNGSTGASSALITGNKALILNGGGTIENYGTITGFNGAILSGPGLLLNEAGGTITGFFAAQIQGPNPTAVNYGSIVCGGGSATLLSFSDANFINEVGGQVYAGPFGFGSWFLASPGTVTNLGTMSGGVGSTVIRLVHGGTLVNGASGDTAAFIGDESGSGAAGVYIGNTGTSGAYGTGLVTNYGTIRSNNPGTAGRGVLLEAGGTVNNSGLIEATGALGVLIANAPGAVINSGTIISNVGSGLYYFGVFLDAGGSVANQVSGLIEGNPGGVAISGGSGTLANLGTIEATGGIGSLGVNLAGGGTLANGAPGLATSLIVGSEGVAFGGAAGTLANYGTITGTSGTAVAFAGTGGNLVNNAQADAVISGYPEGVVITGAAATVTNAGTIIDIL